MRNDFTLPHRIFSRPFRPSQKGLYAQEMHGEHRLCAVLQSSFADPNVQLAHVAIKAKAVYYFRTRLITSRSVELLQFDRIDSDQGQLLVASYPKRSAMPKN